MLQEITMWVADVSYADLAALLSDILSDLALLCLSFASS